MDNERLTEKTWVPLGIAIITIGGAAAWVTSISMSVAGQTAKLSDVEARQIQYVDSSNKIERRLAVIETKLESIDSKLGGRHGR